MELPDSLSKLVAALGALPSIGPKSAQRLALYIAESPEVVAFKLSQTLVDAKKNIKRCTVCFSLTEDDICSICCDVSRNKKIVAVVEKMTDVIAIENTGSYKGLYHVLGGLINPLEHIGPDEIRVKELFDRIKDEEVEEVMLALSFTIEGEATGLYLGKKIKEQNPGVEINRVGSGMPMGADLTYADVATLARAIESKRSV
ncbi:MAG: recombination mediator RecR [Candidatus Shapirobacteria bacterium]